MQSGPILNATPKRSCTVRQNHDVSIFTQLDAAAASLKMFAPCALVMAPRTLRQSAWATLCSVRVRLRAMSIVRVFIWACAPTFGYTYVGFGCARVLLTVCALGCASVLSTVFPKNPQPAHAKPIGAQRGKQLHNSRG